MFQATQLIEFIKEQRKRMSQSPSITDINKYDRINQLIEYLESNTSWEYINGSFIFRANYKYNKEKKDITFDIYKVKIINNHYTSVNNNKKELSFLIENRYILRQLENLQKNQEFFYQDQDNDAETIIAIEEKRIKDAAWAFSIMYYYIGIYKLVDFLNKLTNSSNIENLYQELINQEKDVGFIEQLIQWTKLYSSKGEALYRIYQTDLEKRIPSKKGKAYIMTFPNIKE